MSLCLPLFNWSWVFLLTKLAPLCWPRAHNATFWTCSSNPTIESPTRVPPPSKNTWNKRLKLYKSPFFQLFFFLSCAVGYDSSHHHFLSLYTLCSSFYLLNLLLTLMFTGLLTQSTVSVSSIRIMALQSIPHCLVSYKLTNIVMSHYNSRT